MPIPNSDVEIQDGGLGLSPEIATDVIAYLGCCSGGVANEALSFGGGNPQAIVDALGQGPLVEAAAYANSRGVPVIACKVAQSTAGAAGDVTQVGSGTAILTPSGAPNDSYSVIVAITQAFGDPNDGTGAFRVSLDGGNSYSEEISLPVSGSYVLPDTDLTLGFGSTGTGVVGDTYSFDCTSPVFTTTQLNPALTALLADPDDYFLVSVVGVPADTGTQAGFFAAIASKLAAAEANYRFTRGIMSAYDDTDAALKASALSLSDLRLGIGAGFGTLTSAVSGAQARRPVGHWVTAAKLGVVDPQIDPSQFDLGAEPGLVSLDRDEEATPGLDAARYSTMRTFKGVPGFYVTNGRIMSPPTSDFRYYQYGRVMDIAAKVVRIAGLSELNKPILVDAKTGLIDEKAARAIEIRCTRKLAAETSEKGRCSDAFAQVDRTNNIIATGELRINYSIVPLAYGKTVTSTIGFKNPALTSVS